MSGDRGLPFFAPGSDFEVERFRPCYIPGRGRRPASVIPAVVANFERAVGFVGGATVEWWCPFWLTTRSSGR